MGGGERHRKFWRAAFDEVKRGIAACTATTGSSTRADQSVDVLVTVPPLYLYEPKSDGFGSPARCSADSITRPCLASIAIIRRKLEERLAAGARKHTQIRTRIASGLQPSLSRRDENGEYAVERRSRESSQTKKVQRWRRLRESAAAATSTVGRSLCRATVSVSSRIHRPSGRLDVSWRRHASE